MTARPLVLLCEDGREYEQRFQRFLGAEFEFVRVDDFASAHAACARGPVGLLFDLDFGRLPPERLVDETGQTRPSRGASETRRIAEIQGVLVLRALRAAGVTLPGLIFADLDDPERARFLEQTLAPVAVIPSSESLSAIADRVRAWAQSTL